MHLRMLLFLSLLAAFWATGCVSLRQPHLKVDYYTLEYEPTRVQGQALAAGLRVERFQVSPLYDGERIAFREANFTRGAYDYHRWRANPGDLVAYFMARDFRSSGLFQAVQTMDSQVPTTYAIAGCVEEIVEVDGADRWEAVLSLTITLLKTDEKDPSRQVLMQKNYSSAKACARKHPRALVESMSQAMAEISGRVLGDVHGRLLEKP